MALILSKGTLLKQEIASVFVTVAQLKTISFDGAESETFDSTTLDSGTGKRHTPTGYVEGGSFSASGYYDPALAGHQSLTDLVNESYIAAGVVVPQAWKVVFTDNAATEMLFSTVGASAGIKVDPGAALMIEFKGKLTGLLTFPT